MDILPYPFPNSLMMFFIYSFLGWILEVIYYGITEGKFINRGFLCGPICPVYGIGFYLGIWLFNPLRRNFFIIFFGTAAAATFVELIAGVLLYHIFKLRWWDYSDYKLNLRGYICLRFFIYWGIACSLGIYVLHPAVKRLIEMWPRVPLHVTLALFVLILIADIAVSVTSVIGLSKRIRRLETLNENMHFFSDKIGSTIYGSVDTVMTMSEPAREHYDLYRKIVAANLKEERELALRHRNEERKLAMELTGMEKDNIVNTIKAANKKTTGLLKGIRKRERELVEIIQTRSSDVHAGALRWMKDKTGVIDTIRNKVRRSEDPTNEDFIELLTEDFDMDEEMKK